MRALRKSVYVWCWVIIQVMLWPYWRRHSPIGANLQCQHQVTWHNPGIAAKNIKSYIYLKWRTFNKCNMNLYMPRDYQRLSCFAIFQYDKSLTMPPSAGGWSLHCQDSLQCPGHFVAKTLVRATNIVGHASLQKFHNDWWNIRPIETKLGMWKLEDSVYHSSESQSMTSNFFQSSCEIKPNNQSCETVGRKLTNLFKTSGQSTLLRWINFQPILNIRTSMDRKQKFEFI